MGVGQNVLLLSGVVVLVLGFLLYSPLHPDTDEPFKVRCFFAFFNAGNFLGEIGEWFGYDKYITQRYASEMIAEIMLDPLSDTITMRTTVFDGVNVRIFEPELSSKRARSALVYMHGGSFAFGSSVFHSHVTEMLAYHLDAVVISVDYRLTPEHPFPDGFDDCHAVAMYVFKNARKLHINPADIGVIGDSSGATLSAALAQKLRDDGGKPQFRYQVLIHPITQGLTLDLPSHHTNGWYNPTLLRRYSLAETILMYIGEKRSLAPVILAGNHTTAEIWEKYSHLVNLDHLHMDISKTDFMHHYEINDRTHSSRKHSFISHDSLKKLIHPYAFPLMAESLKNLPAALVVTCESDTLRDDGFLYSRRLRNDGVEVLHHHKRDTAHSYMPFVKSPLWLQAAQRTIEDIVTFVDRV